MSTKHPMVLGMNFYGHNEKIVAGLTEPDKAKHYLDLSSWVPKNTVAIIVGADRITGMGNLRVYPNEGVDNIKIDDIALGTRGCVLVAIKNQRLQYDLTVENDVFDVYLWGYFVERVVGE